MGKTSTSSTSRGSDAPHQRKQDRVTVLVEIDLEALPNAAESSSSSSSSSSPRVNERRLPNAAIVLRKNRAYMTVLQFVLTYPRWSISLFLLFASLTTPLPTVDEEVWQPLANLRAVVQTEAGLYLDCVRAGFALQNAHVDRAVAAEQERVLVQRTAVQQQMRAAAAATARCINSTTAAQRAMQGWNALGLAVPNRTFYTTATNNNNATANISMCSADDQKRLVDMLSQDLTAVQNNVQSILDAYVQASLASLHKILLYSQELSAYNYDYFIGVKIQAAVDLLDHFAAPDIFLTFPEQQLVLDLRGILQGLLDALNGAYIRVDLLATRIAEFKVSIQAFYVNYVDLYGRFEMIGNFVRDFLPDGVAIPDYFDITGIPLPNTLLPPIFSIPEFNGVLPNVEDLASEYIIKAIQLITQLLQDAAEEASEQTRSIIEELIGMLKGLLTLEDYDPPKYPVSKGIATPDDEVAYLQTLAATTQTDSADALDELTKSFNDVPGYEPPVTPDVVVESPTLGETDLTQFTFLDLSYPEITIPVWILTVVGYICSRTFLIECLIQAVRLYRLKRKHEDKSTPDLPAIDYLDGTEHDEKGDENEESKPSKAQLAQVMLLKHMMNPWVILGLMIMPCIFAILILYFPHVKRTCIDSRRGTFLARNVFKQVLVNKANSQGYALYTVAQLQCRSREQTICSAESTQSDAAYRNDAATFFALQTSFNESTSDRGVMSRCVDTDVLDGHFETNCCGLEGYTVEQCSADQQWQFCPIDASAAPPASFRPMGESLLDTACEVDLNALNIKDALFNCSVLEETCNSVPCSGVDADLIGQMTIEADCSVEIYAIRMCIFLALVVYHAIMINVGNTLMFNGIMHIRWKSLSPDGIKMMTHVTHDGELVKGGDRQDRTDRVNKAMKRFVLAGYIQIGLSVAVFCFWMTTFLILKKAASRFHMYHA